MCLYVSCTCRVLPRPEEGIRHPCLELQEVVSFLKSVQGTKHRSSGKIASACNYWVISPSPHEAFKKNSLVAGEIAQWVSELLFGGPKFNSQSPHGDYKQFRPQIPGIHCPFLTSIGTRHMMYIHAGKTSTYTYKV